MLILLKHLLTRHRRCPTSHAEVGPASRFGLRIASGDATVPSDRPWQSPPGERPKKQSAVVLPSERQATLAVPSGHSPKMID